MSLFIKSMFMHIKCQLEYRWSFILTVIASALSSLISIIGVVLLFDKFGAVADWTINDVILTSGIALFGHTVTEMFGRRIRSFSYASKEWFVR